MFVPLASFDEPDDDEGYLRGFGFVDELGVFEESKFKKIKIKLGKRGRSVGMARVGGYG